MAISRYMPLSQLSTVFPQRLLPTHLHELTLRTLMCVSVYLLQLAITRSLKANSFVKLLQRSRDPTFPALQLKASKTIHPPAERNYDVVIAFVARSQCNTGAGEMLHGTDDLGAIVCLFICATLATCHPPIKVRKCTHSG